MSQATELIAQQFAQAANMKKVWGTIIFNVKDLIYAGGAAGNGTTDDTSAVQAAINDAVSKNATLVFFPPGTYKVTALTNASTINFVGDNATFVGYAGTIQDFGVSSITEKNTITPVFNVRGYGAKGDGITDDTAAITAAIAALPNEGGVVYFPKGKYLVSSTIYIGDGTKTVNSTKQRIQLVGAGRGSASGNEDATVDILWNGVGGTLFHMKGVQGGEISGMRLNSRTGADTVLKLENCFYNNFENLTVRQDRAGKDGIRLDGNVAQNVFKLVTVIAQSSGCRAWVIGEGDTLGQSGNMFLKCDGYAAGDVATSCGFYIEMADNNTFMECYTQQSGLLGYGILFVQAAGSLDWAPSENLFLNCPIMAAPGMSIGGAAGRNGTWFIPYPQGDGQNVPALQNIHSLAYDGRIYEAGSPKRTIRNVAIAEATGSVSTTSTTLVNVPGMSVTVNAKAGSKLLVNFSARWFKATAGGGKMYIAVDGSIQGASLRQVISPNDDTAAASLLLDVTVTGNKVITVQYQTTDANAVFMDARQLIVQELY